MQVSRLGGNCEVGTPAWLPRNELRQARGSLRGMCVFPLQAPSPGGDSAPTRGSAVGLARGRGRGSRPVAEIHNPTKAVRRIWMLCVVAFEVCPATRNPRVPEGQIPEEEAEPCINRARARGGRGYRIQNTK